MENKNKRILVTTAAVVLVGSISGWFILSGSHRDDNVKHHEIKLDAAKTLNLDLTNQNTKLMKSSDDKVHVKFTKFSKVNHSKNGDDLDINVTEKDSSGSKSKKVSDSLNKNKVVEIYLPKTVKDLHFNTNLSDVNVVKDLYKVDSLTTKGKDSDIALGKMELSKDLKVNGEELKVSFDELDVNSMNVDLTKGELNGKTLKLAKTSSFKNKERGNFVVEKLTSKEDLKFDLKDANADLTSVETKGAVITGESTNVNLGKWNVSEELKLDLKKSNVNVNSADIKTLNLETKQSDVDVAEGKVGEVKGNSTKDKLEFADVKVGKFSVESTKSDIDKN